jgi:hypothetical protein
MRWSSLLLGVGGLLIFLLAFSGCLAVAALFVKNNQSAPHPAAHAPLSTHTASLPTTTAASLPTNPDWHTYAYPAYGFSVEISTVLYPGHALLINDGSGLSTDWGYNGAPLGSPLRVTAAETTVRVQYSTTISDTNLCPAGGTLVTIGSGIRAYQQTNVPPDLNGPSAPYPYVRVSLVTGGVAIRIELDGQGAPETFFARYGPIWQHMLDSFATFVPLQPLATHPCA